jgi:hypothetical protein
VSFSVFFDFSVGLNETLMAPKGTIQNIAARVQEIEFAFGLETEQYLDNPPHWKSTKPTKTISDKTYCDKASRHNDWVRSLYRSFGEWSKTPVTDGEALTPDHAKTFWHALTMLDVPPERWTADYYRERMEHLYEVMRGRESEGVNFDGKALTPKQASAVICLFDQFLDPADLRLDVPNGRDYLASSSDGGYDWCEKCGPMVWEDVGDCTKRRCPLRAEYRGEN